MNIKRFLIGVSAGAIMLGAFAGPALAATTCTFTTAGTTMTLDADCTTDATIPIPDGYTLDGAGLTIVANDPAGNHFKGAVVANAGSTASVTNLTVKASGLANVCDGGADRLRGIMFDGASGSITHNNVEDINQGASGCQEGNAIEVRNAPFDGTHPGTKSVTITDNTVINYQKTGILANGDVYASISENSVVGVGSINYIAQNGIQVGFGATGSVVSNSVTDNYYTGCSNQDAAKTGCIPWVSAGLLLYDVDANNVKKSKNIYRGNQFNMLLLTSQSINPGP